LIHETKIEKHNSYIIFTIWNQYYLVPNEVGKQGVYPGSVRIKFEELSDAIRFKGFGLGFGPKDVNWYAKNDEGTGDDEDTEGDDEEEDEDDEDEDDEDEDDEDEDDEYARHAESFGLV